MEDVLPHRAPFILVDKVTYFDNTSTVTRTEVKSDNIFVEHNSLQAPALLENIAQTCAVRLGLYNKYVLKREVELGFIGAVKDFRVNRLPQVGETLHTRITVEEEVLNLMLAQAEVHIDDELIASTQIKIAKIAHE